MTRSTISLLLTGFVFLCCVPLAPAGGSSPQALRATLGDDEYRACGLDRLTPDELDRLGRVVLHPRGISHLEPSASRYLERQGFRPIQVLGLLRAEDATHRDDLLLVADGYEVSHLRVWGLGDPLPPGTYWAKNTLSSWDIMRPDGELQHFTEQSR